MNNIINKIIRRTIGGTITIGDFNLKMHRGQSLPNILERYPDYGSNLVRLANVIHSKYSPLKIFDVGCNIGDSVAMLLSNNSKYEIFGIEGDDNYSKILTSNFGQNKSVHIYKNFLGDKNETIKKSICRTGGTLRIDPTKQQGQNTIEIITLDSLIAKNPRCENTKLLKIDTDGFDNKILRGAKVYLTKTKPVIFFEYDSKFLKDNGEIGLDVFDYLGSLNYSTLVFFDNYGRFLVSIDTQNKKTLKQLDKYINDRNGAFAYYDIAAFHSDDADIADIFIKNHEQRD